MAYIYKTKKSKPVKNPRILWYKLRKASELLNDQLEFIGRYGSLEAAEKVHKEWDLPLRYWIKKYQADITDYVKQLGYKVT